MCGNWMLAYMSVDFCNHSSIIASVTNMKTSHLQAPQYTRYNNRQQLLHSDGNICPQRTGYPRDIEPALTEVGPWSRCVQGQPSIHWTTAESSHFVHDFLEIQAQTRDLRWCSFSPGSLISNAVVSMTKFQKRTGAEDLLCHDREAKQITLVKSWRFLGIAPNLEMWIPFVTEWGTFTIWWLLGEGKPTVYWLIPTANPVLMHGIQYEGPESNSLSGCLARSNFHMAGFNGDTICVHSSGRFTS